VPSFAGAEASTWRRRSGIIAPMKCVKQGTRLLKDRTRTPVRIVGFDYDFWYKDRLSRGAVLEEESPLPLGEGGLLYYVCFPEVGDSLVTNPRVDTEAFATSEEAITEAEALVVGEVEWIR
jgi:hypothetical protein